MLPRALPCPHTLSPRSGSDEDQAFVQNLALFLTAFFRAHMPALEQGEELRAALLVGLDTLVSISYVDDDEVSHGWTRWSASPMWMTTR
mgnify:CR=1 FL=1